MSSGDGEAEAGSRSVKPGKIDSERVYTGKIITLDRDTVRFPDDKEGLIGMRVARELEHPSRTP